jgi:tRNA G18 (ribose-2'-O)-methylase SpoU
MIVVGGERHGVSAAVRSKADVVATIPQNVSVESVNAGVAASIALYEWVRRRGADA